MLFIIIITWWRLYWCRSYQNQGHRIISISAWAPMSTLHWYMYVYIHTQYCVRCILRTFYCSPLSFPLLLDLNFFRHLPLDLYTFFNRGHLLTITANRGPIVPLCYKSSVYPLHIPIHTHNIIHTQGNPVHTYAHVQPRKNKKAEDIHVSVFRYTKS